MPGYPQLEHGDYSRLQHRTTSERVDSLALGKPRVELSRTPWGWGSAGLELAFRDPVCASVQTQGLSFRSRPSQFPASPAPEIPSFPVPPVPQFPSSPSSPSSPVPPQRRSSGHKTIIERMIIDPFGIQRINNHPFDDTSRHRLHPLHPIQGIESIPEPTLDVESGLRNTLVGVGRGGPSGVGRVTPDFHKTTRAYDRGPIPRFCTRETLQTC